MMEKAWAPYAFVITSTISSLGTIFKCMPGTVQMRTSAALLFRCAAPALVVVDQ
jgi:hypothetical protein